MENEDNKKPYKVSLGNFVNCRISVFICLEIFSINFERGCVSWVSYEFRAHYAVYSTNFYFL